MNDRTDELLGQILDAIKRTGSGSSANSGTRGPRAGASAASGATTWGEAVAESIKQTEHEMSKVPPHLRAKMGPYTVHVEHPNVPGKSESWLHMKAYRENERGNFWGAMGYGQRPTPAGATSDLGNNAIKPIAATLAIPIAIGFGNELGRSRGWKEIDEGFQRLARNIRTSGIPGGGAVGVGLSTIGLATVTPAAMVASIGSAVALLHQTANGIFRFQSEILAPLNQTAAWTSARMQIGDMRRTMALGEKTSGTFDELGSALSSFKDTIQPLTAFGLNATNKVLSFALGGTSQLINAVSPAISSFVHDIPGIARYMALGASTNYGQAKPFAQFGAGVFGDLAGGSLRDIIGFGNMLFGTSDKEKARLEEGVQSGFGASPAMMTAMFGRPPEPAANPSQALGEAPSTGGLLSRMISGGWKGLVAGLNAPYTASDWQTGASPAGKIFGSMFSGIQSGATGAFQEAYLKNIPDAIINSTNSFLETRARNKKINAFFDKIEQMAKDKPANVYAAGMAQAGLEAARATATGGDVGLAWNHGMDAGMAAEEARMKEAELRDMEIMGEWIDRLNGMSDWHMRNPVSLLNPVWEAPLLANPPGGGGGGRRGGGRRRRPKLTDANRGSVIYTGAPNFVGPPPPEKPKPPPIRRAQEPQGKPQWHPEGSGNPIGAF